MRPSRLSTIESSSANFFTRTIHSEAFSNSSNVSKLSVFARTYSSLFTSFSKLRQFHKKIPLITTTNDAKRTHIFFFISYPVPIFHYNTFFHTVHLIQGCYPSLVICQWTCYVIKSKFSHN